MNGHVAVKSPIISTAQRTTNSVLQLEWPSTLLFSLWKQFALRNLPYKIHSRSDLLSEFKFRGSGKGEKKRNYKGALFSIHPRTKHKHWIAAHQSSPGYKMVIFSAFSIPHGTLRSGSILREGRTLSSRQTSSSCSPPPLATPSLNEPAKMYMMTEEQRNVIDTHHIFKYTSVFVIMFRVYQEKRKQIINALSSRRLSFFQAGYGISERQQISKC